MADERTPAEIEREIEVERAELSRTLDTLTEKFSMDGIVRQVSDQVSEHGGEISANLMRTVRETPAAAILTAIGVGWMIFGSQRRTVVRERYVGRSRVDDGEDYLAENDRKVREYVETHGSHEDSSPSYAGASSAAYAASREPRPAYSRGPSAHTAPGLRDEDEGSSRSFEDRVASADARLRSRETGLSEADPDYGRRDYTGAGVSERRLNEEWRGRPSRGARDYDEDDGDDGPSLAERASDMWGEVVERVQGGYRRAYASATDLKNRLFEGTEHMDDHGRDRVAQARARAYEAQRRAEDLSRQGRDRASAFYYDQPLVAGALAVAVGATIGGLLPRTRREDEAFGAYRDHLFAEAESVFQEERHRAEAAARAALEEAKEVAREKKDEVLGRVPDGKEAMKAAEDEAKSAAQRVADAAREAHDKDSAKTV